MANVLHLGVDAAFPGATLPPDAEILAAYVGVGGAGRPDTPHVWSADDWNGYLEVRPDLRLLPIYVHNFTDTDPLADADNAVASVRALGWAPGLGGTARRIIVVDLETMIAYEWVAAVMLRIYDAGFMPVPYGSLAFVTRNPQLCGYWEAALTARPPAVLGPGQMGVQWAFGPPWDRNVFSDSLYAGCGVGKRKG